MKLVVDNNGFECNLPINRIDMSIENSPKMFQILSDGIYKDKILAVIREYMCNAYDAHVTVGKKDVPFIVNLPSIINPTFSVIDEGSGVDPKEIGSIFWTYGHSTKTEDENTIGALGLGSKSAFSYTKSSFIVKNRYEGVEYTFLCFINEKGIPQGSLVGEVPTTVTNGITVEFAVRSEDINAFHERFMRIYRYWLNVKPIITGIDINSLNIKDPDIILQGTNWYLEKNSLSRSQAIAMMGNVTYKIERESIPNLPGELKVLTDNPFIINFELGDLDFTASRENLSYKENTCKKIIERLNFIKSEIGTSFKEKVFNEDLSQLNMFKMFFNTYEDIRKILYIKDHYILNKLIFGCDSEILFKGHIYLIEDLISGKFTYNSDVYLDYGMFQYSNNKILSATNLIFTSIEEMKSCNLFDIKYPKDILEVGTELKCNWMSSRISPNKKILTSIEKAFRLKEKFKIETFISLKIDNKCDKLIFMINDLKVDSRKTFLKYVSSNLNTQFIYVDIDKVTTPHDIFKKIEVFCNYHLNGSDVKFLSSVVIKKVENIKNKDILNLKSVSYYEGSIISKTLSIIHNSRDLYDSIKDIKLQTLNMNNISEHEFEIDELKNNSHLYVIKYGSKFYEDKNVIDFSIFRSNGLIEFANHIGIFDDFKKQNINVINKKLIRILILSKTQYSHMIKIGIKLKSIKEVIFDKLKIEEEDHKILLEINTYKEMKSLYVFNNLYNSKKISELCDGLMKFYMDEFDILINNIKKINIDLLMNIYINEFLNIKIKPKYDYNTIFSQLNERYPMIFLTGNKNYIDSNELKKIVVYINQIDKLF